MSKNSYSGIDRKIVSPVRYYAWKIKSHLSFCDDDVEDIEQDLMLFALSKLELFDQQKSELGTFVSNVLKNKVKNMIKERMAKKNEFQYSKLQIDEYESRNAINSDNVLKTIDINTFIFNNLSKHLQETCELLKYYSVSDVAEILGKSSSAIYQRIEKIRQRMNVFVNCDDKFRAQNTSSKHNVRKEK